MKASWFRRVAVACGWMYLALLVAVVVALRFVGEAFWLTGMALYFPRAVSLVPSGALVLVAFALKLPQLLTSQVACALLVVFPLMGFVVPHPRAAAGAAPLRLLSFNVESCGAGADALAERVRTYAPDVVLMQEVCKQPRELTLRLREQYPVVHSTGQFLLASRYPLLSTEDPGPTRNRTRSRIERFMRYELDTPLGRIALYNVHPVSPRWAFYAAKGMRVRTSLRNGTLLRGGAAEGSMRENFEVRERQLAAAVQLANRDDVPRIVAGDTNLPGLSPVLRHYLADYQDGFEAAGWGFGYTFPSGLPWMRIDRIFASHELRFVGFRTGCGDESDHRCVIAELARASSAQ